MPSIKLNQNEEYISLILDNTAYGNSFGYQEAQTLREYKPEIDKHRRLVFRSTPGRNFCAGGNLSFYQSKSYEECIEANRFIASTMNDLYCFPGSSLCVVEGNCFGGGMELISCFDRVVATPDSYFGFWQRRMALSLGWGGRDRWLNRVPIHQLKSLCLSSESLSAYQAKSLGLIDDVIPNYKMEEYVATWAVREEQLPQSSVAAIKNFKSKEQQLFESVWFNSEHQELLKKT